MLGASLNYLIVKTYITKHIPNFQEYISNIQKLDTKGIMLFRGQSLDRPLIPKIGRLTFRNNENLFSIEKKIFYEFKRLSIPHVSDVFPNNNWEWLALAQHHCLPTRLLDWSTNPLAALWFATNNSQNSNDDGVVWVFSPKDEDIIENTETTDPFRIRLTRLFQPNIVAQRINAQSGWFSAHKLSATENRFIPFEQNKFYKNQLTKFIIYRKHFSDFRYDLDRFGINRSTLFPDLDGLATHIQWLYTLLEDEGNGYTNYK